MSKVIDLTQRLTKPTNPKSALVENPSAPAVVDFEEQKQKLAFRERRTARRTLFNEMMSSMVVIPERGLLKVFLYDISDDGLAFDTAVEDGAFSAGEEVSLRIYINHKTYFPVKVTVRHLTQDTKSGTIRHGTTLIKDASNDVVLQYFVKFIEAAALLLKKDSGDLMVNKTS